MVMSIAMLSIPNRVGLNSMWIMLLAAWLTWAMAMSEAANSWWGTKQTLTITASQANATGGEPWQELVVTLTHLAAGVALIIAWGLFLFGFLNQDSKKAMK